MATINGYRMDGLGNDFIIIDRRENFINLNKEQIIKLGDRQNIGFDQIIFIEKEKDNLFPLTIFNSDGGEISACGNGSRCTAYLLSEKTNLKSLKLKTKNRILDAEIVGNLSVRLNMGKPIYNWKKIPLSKEIDNDNVSIDIEGKTYQNGFCLNIGNPHIVFFVKNCFDYDLKVLGSKIEHHPTFPERTNVTFAQINSESLISVNVWERGAGLTKACGTAACATAVAAFKKKLVNNKTDIKFKEGVLNIEIDRNDFVFMTGSVSKIKDIKIEI